MPLRSRDEIALWKEKQAQVSREEQRLRESLAAIGQNARPTAPQTRGAGEAAKVRPCVYNYFFFNI